MKRGVLGSLPRCRTFKVSEVNVLAAQCGSHCVSKTLSMPYPSALALVSSSNACLQAYYNHLCASADCCMSAARIPDRRLAHLDNQVSTPKSLSKQWLRGLRSFQLNRQAFYNASGSQLPIKHNLSGNEQPGEYSQLRRGGHLLEANGRQQVALHVCKAHRSDRRDRRVSQQVACLLCVFSQRGEKMALLGILRTAGQSTQ